MRIAPPLTLITTLLLPTATSGQTEGRLPRVLELPASTRAMALGDAYVMDGVQADALFYHPALLAGAGGFGLGVQTWGEASAAAAAVATPWLGGGIAFGLQVLQYSLPSSGDPPGGPDHLFQVGEVPASERIVSLGFGRAEGGLLWGAAGRVAEVRVGTARDALVLLDVGLAHEVGPLQVGVTYHGLGGGADADGWEGPTRLTLGAGHYGHPVGIFDLGASAAVSRRADGEVLAGAGLEVGYWPIDGRTFLARFGIQHVPEGDGSPLSFGLAFWGDSLALDWAYRPFGGDVGDGTHRFSVSWR